MLGRGADAYTIAPGQKVDLQLGFTNNRGYLLRCVYMSHQGSAGGTDAGDFRYAGGFIDCGQSSLLITTNGVYNALSKAALFRTQKNNGSGTLSFTGPANSEVYWDYRFQVGEIYNFDN